MKKFVAAAAHGVVAGAVRTAAGVGRDEIAVDAFHHVVYATATAVAYEALA